MSRQYIFKKPEKIKNNYIIFKDVTLPPMKYPYTCLNTITSNCERDLSVDECVEKCNQSKLCDAGYYLRPSNDKSYC